jgi:hypothetical protein
MHSRNAWFVRLVLLATSIACAGWKWDGGATPF